MVTSKERQEVAKQLRENALRWRKVIEENAGITGEIDLGDVCSIMQDVMHFCGIDGKTDAPTILDRLADLIDPTCRIVSGDADNHMPHCNLCGTGNFDLLPKYCKGCGARIVYNENVN